MHKHTNGDSCADSCCLKVQNLSVRAGAEEILSGIDLHIHCGQLVALIGPNGAGKSTLLRAILGQIPHGGQIVFTGAEGQNHLRIGYVPQTPSFDRGDPISVLDLFTCCISHRPSFLPAGHALRKRVQDCLAKVQAEELIDRRIGALSGGELQRVLLALALEPLPNLLILDEPLSGVDVEGMNLLMQMLDSIRRRFDLSILMTTHDFSLLPRYADRVVLLKSSVRKAGTPQEVLGSEEFRQLFHLEGGGAS